MAQIRYRPQARSGVARKFYEDLAFSATDECINWPYGQTVRGYAFMRLGDKRGFVSRFVCLRFHGPPVNEMIEAAHSCGNQLCVNPRHIRWATAVENAADRVGHGTAHRGENHPKHILTATQVDEIKVLRDGGMKLRVIGERYGVSESTVCRIVTGSRWNH